MCSDQNFWRHDTGQISCKYWWELSYWGIFHDNAHFSLIKSYGFIFCTSEIFLKKAISRNMQKLPPREKFHVFVFIHFSEPTVQTTYLTLVLLLTINSGLTWLSISSLTEMPSRYCFSNVLSCWFSCTNICFSLSSASLSRVTLLNRFQKFSKDENSCITWEIYRELVGVTLLNLRLNKVRNWIPLRQK